MGIIFLLGDFSWVSSIDKYKHSYELHMTYEK